MDDFATCFPTNRISKCVPGGQQSLKEAASGKYEAGSSEPQPQNPWFDVLVGRQESPSCRRRVGARLTDLGASAKHDLQKQHSRFSWLSGSRSLGTNVLVLCRGHGGDLICTGVDGGRIKAARAGQCQAGSGQQRAGAEAISHAITSTRPKTVRAGGRHSKNSMPIHAFIACPCPRLGVSTISGLYTVDVRGVDDDSEL